MAGESLTPRGLLSASTAQTKKLGLLSLKRQKRELEDRILKVQAKLSALREREEKQQAQLQAASQDLTNREESLRQLEKEMIGLTHQEEQWKEKKSSKPMR